MKFTEQMFALFKDYDIILKASSGAGGAESGNNENGSSIPLPERDSMRNNIYIKGACEHNRKH